MKNQHQFESWEVQPGTQIMQWYPHSDCSYLPCRTPYCWADAGMVVWRASHCPNEGTGVLGLCEFHEGVILGESNVRNRVVLDSPWVSDLHDV
jgi:hypothetical protein